ncbi:filamentous hemagglutinin N-terminal domain-containing protein [Candidatus Parabeggiatoa sp. HSG14]|uniref:two-partner secretion domain-containing protein n=1 Tax=Candidatus Parabeggiatoa sp. HSG14 TaxID=3055593 RepID=UPI0025A88DD4|nr:filamentous hemagglutinin N-terminal domain-containing protein [Thiotrichales bacterium HSG14]
MKSPPLLTIPLLIISLSTNAEITTDGSLGSHANLPGPDYLIGADLGSQLDGNLFHSFQDFNLNSSESATFSGPNSVSNIISRVTGGNPSNIDGLIRSTIPNADMYFLNPYGIMFGPNAQLDVQGSFHASTADYLRLGENGRFDARNPSDSILTVAPIESFGFLSDTPTTIALQDSILSVDERKTLSLIGGDLNLNGELLSISGTITTINREFTTQLIAPNGRINLASIASKGEVIPTESKLDVNAKTGDLIIDQGKITTSAIGGGDIFIRSGQFKLMNGDITATTFGEQEGGTIDIRADNIILEGVENYSDISSNTLGAGRGGRINLYAKQLDLSNGATITTGSAKTGDGGDIFIKVNGTFTFSGKFMFETKVSSGIFASTLDSGHGGNIEIEANKLVITEGAQISSGTFGSGKGGNVFIKVKDILTVSGKDRANFMSGIYASTQPLFILDHSLFAIDPSYNTGDAGSIKVEADKIILSNGGKISTTSLGLGNAGFINVKTNELIATGKNFHEFFKEYFHSGISSSSVVANEIGGQAGNIIVQADIINLANEAKISTAATNAGGGNIEIDATNYIYLRDGKITTSVKGGSGDGGNITIEYPTFVVMDKGKIIAQADEGRGGNIRIAAEQFIKSPDSLISASSKLGIDGEINIDSPTVDMNAFIIVLSGGFVEAQLKQCTTEEIENPNIFKVDLTRKKVLPFGKFRRLE